MEIVMIVRIFIMVIIVVIMGIAFWGVASRNAWKIQAEYRSRIIDDYRKQLRDNGIEPESETIRNEG